MTTTENKELVERLESHMGLQDVPVLLHDCREAAARIRKLEADRHAFSLEIKRLEEEADASDREFAEMAAARDAAEARCRKLEEALRLYADMDNWRQNGPMDANGGNFTGMSHATRALRDQADAPSWIRAMGRKADA